MKEKIKILVACHKQDVYSTDNIYLPIHVGKTLSQLDLGVQADNEGINISEKNPYYCELTAMYWAWKNLKGTDIIGLCHYRRYLDFHNQCRPVFASTTFTAKELGSLDLSLDEASVEQVREGAVIVAKPEVMNCTLKQNYCEYHVSEDLEILKSILIQMHGDKYLQAYETVVERGCQLSPYNMFVMRWEDFDAYCAWLFSILEKVEEATKIDTYNTFQKRIYGFMAERLFNVWLCEEKKQVITKPVIFVNDADTSNHHIGPRKLIREILRIWRCKRINKLYNKARS